jgi:cell division septation protein DedD
VSAGSGRTLSRDYKHVKRHTPGTPAFSGWTGLAVGLTIGLGVALAVHLHDRGQIPAAPEPDAGAKPASAKASEETPVPVEAGEASQDLTFYDMLPKQEVEVPKEVAKAAAPASALPTGDVVLQAGSFKQPAEADKLQARLAQYGIDAKIQRYSLEDETWYRVRIGPLATVEELEAVRAKLAEAEIEATPAARSPVESPP